MIGQKTYARSFTQVSIACGGKTREAVTEEAVVATHLPKGNVGGDSLAGMPQDASERTGIT